MGWTANVTGQMAERIVWLALSRPVAGRYGRSLFRATFLGDKHPVVDLLVETLGARGEVRGLFFAQVKGTTVARPGTSRIQISISPESFNHLVSYPVPTYVVAVDVVRGKPYITAAHRRRRRWTSGIPTRYSLQDDESMIRLYREVDSFWRGRRRTLTRTEFRDG